MPRFTKGDDEIETSNQVEIVRLRASGYTPVATKGDESTDEPPKSDESTDEPAPKPRGRNRS